MARPLSKTILEKMAVSVETKSGSTTLVKQVGYNKYIDSNNKIITLKDKLVEDCDSTLKIKKGDEEMFVTKISLHMMYTANGSFAYTVGEKGVSFIDENVSFAKTTETSTTNSTKTSQTTERKTTTTTTPKTETKPVETTVVEPTPTTTTPNTETVETVVPETPKEEQKSTEPVSE